MAYHAEAVGTFQQNINRILRYGLGVTEGRPQPKQVLWALSLAVRDALVDRLAATERAYAQAAPKAVHYLCMEYLIGRLLRSNLMALGLEDEARAAVASMGFDLSDLIEEEPDPGLGNGGLGRLAACFLDSLATLDMPAWGYGLRYEYGIFHQEFLDGWQRERPDRWLEQGTPWEICRPELHVPVLLGGRVEWIGDRKGELHPAWVDWRMVWGVPYDIPVAGFGTGTVGTLRLWRAVAPQHFDFDLFSQGDLYGAVAQRDEAEAITKVLYPADNVEVGRDLRLVQEYFLVACSVRDVVRRFRLCHGETWETLPERAFFQLNDTHPALTIAELMRFLVDEANLDWERAWEITRASCGYTNHTLLPEALETWDVGRFASWLPRHTEIIFEINRRFLAVEVELRYPGDEGRKRSLSLVREDGEKRFAMAHLATVGSRRINGVARLHSELLRSSVLRDFAELFPERFVSITNGITPRRWLLGCNPRLAALVTEVIGEGWVRNLLTLGNLSSRAEDPGFADRFLAVKRANKMDLAVTIQRLLGIAIDPDSLFDVQIKRLHLYKRQLLNALHILTLYLRLKADPHSDMVPRTFVFGAKAAPAYWQAKRVIKLINSMGAVINGDPATQGRLAVVFLPDYRVSLAEKIIPAADLSEQISTAGTEASGTGNMKLALNGAVTIGTLDGANVEILEAVGEANIFIFGLKAPEVAALRARHGYDPRRLVAEDEELGRVIAALGDGTADGGCGVGQDILRILLLEEDPYLHLADYRAYIDAQERAATSYVDQRRWAAMAIRNIAGMGVFSSDRAVREYADLIWGVKPLPVEVPTRSEG